jgi:hypothetical protein
MKLLVLVAVTALGLGTTACGGVGKDTSGSHASSRNGSTGDALVRTGSSVTRTHDFLGDQDDDDEAGENPHSSKDEADSDFDDDAETKDKGYFDADDNSVRTYGHAAVRIDTQEIVAVVKLYYAAAAAGDGARACLMILPSFGKTILEDYGRAPGPAYLRGAKTCAAVMTLLFRHVHRQVAATFEVTGVRVEGISALAILGSRVLPVRYLSLERQGGAWRIVGLLDEPLP